jgi:hypothetical protein
MVRIAVATFRKMCFFLPGRHLSHIQQRNRFKSGEAGEYAGRARIISLISV